VAGPWDRIRQYAYSQKHYHQNREKILADVKAYREKNRARFKDYQLRRDYGITLSLYLLLLDHQNGVCALCQRPPGKRALSVDHDHRTGKVRGLLCPPCNRSLYMVEDLRLHDRALKYLNDTLWTSK
jgi:hypothetical protein